ncbi:MAG: glucosaminidase domain-containing protein [Proteobacteria bacterium]|nr:glucosaminidase domain-containing protein [Pseudomonadota bacterium]
MMGRGWTIGGKAVGASHLWAAISRLFSLIGLGASYVASVRFEYKSLTVVGAGIAALYILALGNPAEPFRGADAATAFFESPRRTPVVTAPESLAALIIEKSALPEQTQPESVASLVDLYQDIDYRLDNIRLGEMAVPRILLDKLPADFAVVESPTERKQLFIKLALPLILYANERIAAERERLIALSDKIARTSATAGERAWLAGLADRYGLETPDIDILLKRVDVIPPSLALAQGAEESGWGTSRFVREGNAIFGQRTYDKGAGLVPELRDPDATHEVKSFNGLMDSVISYMTNLNTHAAYDNFRRIRADQRASGGVDSYSLVGSLVRYSERGEAYIETIRSIIDINDLRSYDGASFGKIVAGDPI